MEHDVMPDIVTMAKAAGNGHPLGFVVTTSARAKAFSAEGSFFSSAGGNPVRRTLFYYFVLFFISYLIDLIR
jgi:4-aminobutyrate aminotransferase-like enzyme